RGGGLAAAGGEPREEVVPLADRRLDLRGGAVVAADAEVLLDGEAAKRAAPLRDVPEAEPGDRPAPPARQDLLPVQPRAARGGDHPGERAQQGGLARPVRAEDDGDAALLD